MKSEKVNPRCPDCDNFLHEVITSTQYGTQIKLDQCGRCGGIWFDSLELYPLSEVEVRRIENIDLNKLQESKFLAVEARHVRSAQLRFRILKI